MVKSVILTSIILLLFLRPYHHGIEREREVIQFYNETKSRVNIMDKLLRRYAMHRHAFKWSLALLFNIGNVAELVAYIIHTKNFNLVSYKIDNRHLFLRELTETTSLPAIQDISQNIQALKLFRSNRELKVN